MNSEIIFKEEQTKQMKSKVEFKNLKSNYFLLQIFDIMKKNRALKIIKYNKILQKRLNLNIINYKECSQLYSSIEIELKLNDIEHDDKFINISDDLKEYYHIYFDNSNEEIKRNYLKEKEKINIIKIVIDYQLY